VITHAAFTVEPWSVRETYLDLDMLAACESVFALSKGIVADAVAKPIGAVPIPKRLVHESPQVSRGRGPVHVRPFDRLRKRTHERGAAE
jgi:hypothetical protein